VEESIRMTEDITGINEESTSMVWPTLGSRTAKEQNRTRYAGEQIDRHADSHDCRNVGGVNINNLQHTIK